MPTASNDGSVYLCLKSIEGGIAKTPLLFAQKIDKYSKKFKYFRDGHFEKNLEYLKKIKIFVCLFESIY